jgi:hypothetical protein|tara:strand:- start:963 stop:1316 length:354 start_codon:yes stop_codon:yes gene_type:complete
MMKLLALIGAMLTVSACSTTPQYEYHDNAQYCYQTTTIETKGNQVSSEGLTECSDKPRVEHVVKDVGLASDCRISRPLDTNRGDPKAGETMLCKFTDHRGQVTWRPVNAAFAYPTFD